MTMDHVLFRHATADAPPRVFVIAEIGVNHDGDVGRALELIDHAASAGVDAVKFQCFDPRNLLSNQAVLSTYQHDSETDPFEMLDRLLLGADDLIRCADAANRSGMRFVLTPFSVADVAVLDELQVDLVKIASPDAVNLPLLKTSAGLGKPMLISTGAASLDELDRAADFVRSGSGGGSVGVGGGNAGGKSAEKTGGGLSEDRLCVGGALLQCVSRYPTPIRQAALGGIIAMREKFPDIAIGYSDHTSSEFTGALAVAAGACVIEKHLTYDRGAAGPDHAASSDPKQLSAYVKHIRVAAESLGSISKTLGGDEHDVRHTSRQSVCAVRDLPIGHVLTVGDLTVKRPGSGIPAACFDEIIGCALGRTVRANDLLHDADLA